MKIDLRCVRSMLFGCVRMTCCIATAALATSASFSAAADPLDWTNWRGPEQMNISRETGLVDSWDPRSGENVLWRKEEFATRSTPIVMNGRLYTLCRSEPGTPREGERVVCLDAATGDLIWENRFNVFLSDVPDTRVAWSCVAGDPETGRVYALGVCGYFQCLDGDTGETLWSYSLSEEFGLLSTYGGRTNVPVVVDDLVIISSVIIGWGDMAKPAHRFLGFDKLTGEVRWFNGTRLLPYDTTYSTPFVTAINGQKAMVFGSGDGGTWAMQPRTGLPIWNFQLSRRGNNVSPVVYDNRVFMSQSQENVGNNTMGSLVAIDAIGQGDITATGEIWRINELTAGSSSPLIVDGRLYVVDDSGGFYVVDPEAGQQIGNRQRLVGTIMRSTPLYADGRFYVCTTSAWHILEPTEDGVKLVERQRMPAGEEVYGSLVVSHGRIYLPTTGALYCLASADTKPGVSPMPSIPEEEPIGSNTQPAHLQLVPAESLIRPGEKLSFRARLFNDRGQFLHETEEVTFSIDGGGQIDAAGHFTADSSAQHVAVGVTAKSGELTGTARIRIVPPLPWSFDFDDGEVPITWVGARYRHISVDYDLLKSLEARIPLAAHLYIYLMTDFTNNSVSTVTYDASMPRRTWQKFGLYLGLIDALDQSLPVDAARQKLEPALALLGQEKVLAAWAWQQQATDPLLTVERGPRTMADGNGVMLKISTIPLGTRSQGWMGHANMANYTVQADVSAADVSPEDAVLTDAASKMPDAGVIAQRYTLDLMGASQQVQIRSWTPQLDRFSVSVPFAWKPEVWYRIKFRAEPTDDGRAVLRGKVWPRDESEPSEWTIEGVDEGGNVVGSPGLFGNAKDAEVYFDNVVVTAN